jgi:UDP-glucose 4-epimerase
LKEKEFWSRAERFARTDFGQASADGELGKPERVTVFSRDEAKQHYMRLDYLHRENGNRRRDLQNSQDLLNFRIGDVGIIRRCSRRCGRRRDFSRGGAQTGSVVRVFPFEAILTNIYGAENIVRAIRENNLPIETVVGISTIKPASRSMSWS